MFLTLFPKLKLVIFEHPEKATSLLLKYPLIGTPPAHAQYSALNITVVNPVQLLKALLSMKVTEFGIVTDVKPLHPENADIPMEVTELGIVTDVKPVQPEKA